MRIVVIGATGIIGQAIVAELNPRHEVIRVGHQSGDSQVDMSDMASVQAMYQAIGNIDAVVVAAGRVHFAALTQMKTETIEVGLHHKLMGQVNVVLAGLTHLNDHGSFTLTSGIINRDPIATGSSAAMVNGAVDGFVKAAAIEMPRGLRINAVSPTVITEAMDQYGAYFRGFEPVSASRAARAYSKSVEGLQTGQVYCVGGGVFA